MQHEVVTGPRRAGGLIQAADTQTEMGSHADAGTEKGMEL